MKYVTLLYSALFFLGCQTETQSPDNAIVLNNVFKVTSEWARPAASGTNTAAYFELQNGLSTADTLLNVYSTIAEGVQIHESFMADDGLAGMRHHGQVSVPSGSSVALEPGGIHVMFLQLKEDLAIGDSIQVDLEFKHQGIRTLTIPIKSIN